MSATRTIHHTIAGAVTAAATAAVLCVLGGAAAADPAAPNSDACTHLLEQVTEWPGTLGDGSRHVSDAYEIYLLRREPCTRMP